jgi:methylated-DNA-[protein]-cysteine S-methyltransferase
MNAVNRYDFVPSPLGTLLLVARDGALAGIYFQGQRYAPAVAADWQRAADDPVLSAARVQLTEYFAGRRTEFALPLAPQGTPFQRAVWAAIATVPYGATVAYRELAARAGRPGSVRAAGTATGRNPLTIVVPCHRIVGADGALTGYAGGLERKRALLALEARGAALAHRCTLGAARRPSETESSRALGTARRAHAA